MISHHAALTSSRQLSLDSGDVLSLGALSTFADLKFDELVLFQATETVALNLGVVDENVRRTVSGSDEAVALLRVEPFHSSLCHCNTFFIFVVQHRPYFRWC